ncbi:carbohydrate ABC transporter permease [Paenibacillus eucommiae]|uniref:Multiple sugar transport system permease protein n=1 Tax=Paenibacillus eucommiae TaxID=1355755 RepID=A0ABS4J1Y2_9BACL|nr:carbohydrate ABC transporter permease [Paenibacillus eucommiae]MBP1993863.1 multiple sugar transport system permease protein [Paenibacillus eucommiae]
MVSDRLVREIARFAFLIVSALGILLPVWLLLVSSFRQTTNLLSYPPKLWPDDGDFSNYINLFTGNTYHFGRWFLNSAVVCGVGAVFMLLFCSMAGYAFAKKQFAGKQLLIALILATTMIPGIVTLIPSFLIVDKLGWTNSYLGLILPTIPNAFGVFMMMQFIRVLPGELLESAKLDGCGEYGMFFRIVLPIIQPSLGVLAIFHFILNWGSLLWPLIITTEEKMKTLPVAIAGMRSFGQVTSGEMMAATFLSFIPLFVVFLFAREKFIEGVTAGAVKG